MAAQKMTHEVTHNKLYMMVGGKLVHIAKGTQLALDGKTAAGLIKKDFVQDLKPAKTAKVGSDTTSE